jgi:uncharacterized membrane protein
MKTLDALNESGVARMQPLFTVHGSNIFMSSRGNFWAGLGVGAGIGAAVALLPQLVGRGGASRILRLEKSIQIGRPVEEVFGAWVDWDRLPGVSDNIASIRHNGDRTHWRVNVGGRLMEWNAITEQYIPNQAIGWKSINGPKHTGRITFAPIGSDTQVHVAMNYVPPSSRALRPFLRPMTGHMEGVIEKVLRDFKGSVESRPHGVQGSVRRGTNRPGPGMQKSEMSRSGTYGDDPIQTEPRLAGAANPMDFTSPPDAKR